VLYNISLLFNLALKNNLIYMKKIFQKEYFMHSLLILVSFVIVIYAIDFPFYWDNSVQISFPANWYYETNFNYFYLPDNIATGHPTFVGMYFAFLWKIFGRSLAVCHLGMFPFVYGFLLQTYKLIINLKINDRNTVLILLSFVLFDTTIMSQLSLITFDIIQLFFLFLSINAILKKKPLLLSIAFLLLVMTSFRGTISSGGVLIFHALYVFFISKKFRANLFFPYLPGIIGMIVFLVLFKLNNGWVIHNTVSSAWAESGKLASFKEMIINAGVFVWRLIDFGRIAIYILFSYFIFTVIKTKKVKNEKIEILLLIAISQFIVFFPIIIIYKNPFAHRYLIPIIIPITLLTVYWVILYLQKSKLIIIIMFLSLLSGPFWLYPEKISQGWDGSTIHWNFFSVANEMDKFIDEEKIPREQVGTFFSLYQSKFYSHIDTSKVGYKKANLLIDKYLLYSNSFNVSDGVIDSVNSKVHWNLIKEYEQNRIFLKLYERK